MTWSGWRPKAEAAALYQYTNAPAQLRQELALEPGMALEPARVAPARMREREIARQVLAPGVDGLAHRAPRALMQVIVNGVRADQQGQLDVRKMLEDLSVPARRAFPARREVAALHVDPG